MKSIEFIEIKIDNKLYFINNKEKIINLIRIIRNWQQKYESSNVIDGEEFLIKIVCLKEAYVIHGKGSYPKNYLEFKNWIRTNYD